MRRSSFAGADSDGRRLPTVGFDLWGFLSDSTSWRAECRTGSRWCSPTGSGVIRPCGGWSLRAFADRFRVVLFDHAGSRANPGEYDADRHVSLDGYTEDVLAILDGLDLHDVIFVGHSVSAMIGVVLAAKQDPGRFAQLVLVGPPPYTSTTTGTSAGSIARTSTSCSQTLRRTTSAGRVPWPR